MAQGAAGSPMGGASDVDTGGGGGGGSRFPVVATIKSALSPLWSESAQWEEKWIPPKSALIAWCGAAALTAAGTFSAAWALRWYRRRRAGDRSALPISTKGGRKAVAARGAGTRRPPSLSAHDAKASFSQSRRGGDTASKRYSVGGSPSAPKLIELDMSPEELLAETEAVMGEERALADHIASLFTYIRAGAVLLEPPLDFAHTFQLLADIEAKNAVRRSSLTFPGYVSPHVELREASVTAQKSLAKHDIELGTRVDVYRVLKAIAEEYEEQLADALRRQQALLAEEEAANKRDQRHDSDSHSRAEGRRARDAFDRHTAAAAQAAAACGLSLEHVRYMRYTIRDYERLGMHLDDIERERFVALRTRISDLCIEYQRNLNEEDTRVWFRADQLAGMPASFLTGLRQRRNAQRPEEAEYEVTLKYPHYFPLMKHCRVEETRRLMERLFNSRCVPENVALLEEAVKLRDDAAKLLGYSSHAAYVLDTRMAGSPAAVTQFLRRISKRMERAAQTELAELRRLKRRELLETGAGRHLSGGTAEIDDRLFMWDLRYYMTRYEQERFQIDHETVSEYFPLEWVVSGMFQIYQDLLGLRFVELPDAPRWHEEVRAFAVRDGSSAQLMGYFYLDLHPREGKYGHAAVWPLQPGCVAPEAVRHRRGHGHATAAAASACGRHGGQLLQTDRRAAVVAAPRRGGDAVPRIRPRHAPHLFADAVCPLFRDAGGARFRRSAVADAGELVLGACGADQAVRTLSAVRAAQCQRWRRVGAGAAARRHRAADAGRQTVHGGAVDPPPSGAQPVRSGVAPPSGGGGGGGRGGQRDRLRRRVRTTAAQHRAGANDPRHAFRRQLRSPYGRLRCAVLRLPVERSVLLRHGARGRHPRAGGVRAVRLGALPQPESGVHQRDHQRGQDTGAVVSTGDTAVDRVVDAAGRVSGAGREHAAGGGTRGVGGGAGAAGVPGDNVGADRREDGGSDGECGRSTAAAELGDARGALVHLGCGAVGASGVRHGLLGADLRATDVARARGRPGAADAV
eukprot:ctg_281.g172